MKEYKQFRFKQFSLWHHRSSMKVGVDGVLIGCWTNADGAGKILDVGTGCGLIALILAQRSPESQIIGIDVHEASVEEAGRNVNESPWRERIRIVKASFTEEKTKEMWTDGKFDLIISNPPYFNSGLTEIITARERARHQSDLSPYSLLEGAKDLLNPDGSVSMVIPMDICDDIERFAEDTGYSLKKKCLVRGHLQAPYKRVLLQWSRIQDANNIPVCDTEFLTLESTPGNPTTDYLNLCKNFYLKF